MTQTQLDLVIQQAVKRSQSIERLVYGSGVLNEAITHYTACFGERPALLIADENTWSVAGARLEQGLKASGIQVHSRILPAAPRPKPYTTVGEELTEEIRNTQSVPVSIGSGVINDLVKYAAHQAGEPYFCVATAASMDGYASSGAAMIHEGFKKSISCTAPRLILADLELLRQAPTRMAGWGYGDLAGKVPAGADWILADALGVEPRDEVAWPLVQDHLQACLAQPEGLDAQDSEAYSRLFIGLTLTGLAMEFHGTSRPASGADHQIAHLWEMSQHQHQGELVSHGACVGIGCLTVLALYEWLFQLEALPIPQALNGPTLSWEAKAIQIQEAFPEPRIAEKAFEETRAKHTEPQKIHQRLRGLQEQWPELQPQLKLQLTSLEEMRQNLRAAGAPGAASEIGITAENLRKTVQAARFLRSRYTVLDLLEELGLLEVAVRSASLPY